MGHTAGQLAPSVPKWVKLPIPMRARRYHNDLMRMLNATDRSAIIAVPVGLNESTHVA